MGYKSETNDKWETNGRRQETGDKCERSGIQVQAGHKRETSGKQVGHHAARTSASGRQVGDSETYIVDKWETSLASWGPGISKPETCGRRVRDKWETSLVSCGPRGKIGLFPGKICESAQIPCCTSTAARFATNIEKTFQIISLKLRLLRHVKNLPFTFGCFQQRKGYTVPPPILNVQHFSNMFCMPNPCLSPGHQCKFIIELVLDSKHSLGQKAASKFQI